MDKMKCVETSLMLVCLILVVFLPSSECAKGGAKSMMGRRKNQQGSSNSYSGYHGHSAQSDKQHIAGRDTNTVTKVPLTEANENSFKISDDVGASLLVITRPPHHATSLNGCVCYVKYIPVNLLEAPSRVAGTLLHVPQ